MGGIFQQTNENIKQAWMLEYRKYRREIPLRFATSERIIQREE